MRYKATIFLIVLAMVIVPGLKAQDYKKISIKKSDIPFLTIKSSQNRITFNYLIGTTDSVAFSASEVVTKAGQVRVRERVIIDEDGFSHGGRTVPFEDITRVEVESMASNGIVATLYIRDTLKTTGFKISGGNIIETMRAVKIDSNKFVRGSAICFWGDIDIPYGEVSGNVIALFGNITIGEKSVIRGNVVAINGQAILDKNATIHGMISSSDFVEQDRKHRWQRWYRTDQYVSPIMQFNYNRVDGARPEFGIKFFDEDSLWPEIKIYGGYAFAQEKERYQLEIDQHLKYRGIGFTVRGRFYQRLASDDDWLMPEWENSLFALIGTEDYKDYYEAQGGFAGIEIRPMPLFSFKAGFQSELMHWMNANRNLWSLFGGSKRFRSNYHTFNESIADREALSGLINGRRLKSLIFSVDYGRKGTAYTNNSFTKISAEFELAPSGWNDDFDFNRFRFEGARYQSLTRSTGALLRILGGISDGTLPYFRRFYLGGLTTLKGYGEKEFQGTDFWAADINYRLKLSRFNLTGWLFYNAGQIASEEESLGDAELKQSVGGGLTVFDFIRFDLAFRLDKSESSPTIYVRLDNWF